MMIVLVAGVSCKDLTRDPGLPAGTPDPSIYNTASGAMGLRTAAVFQMIKAIPTYIFDVGLLSDELVTDSQAATRAINGGMCNAGTRNCFPLDQRLLPEGVEADASNAGPNGIDAYAFLQNVRGATNVALGALAAYDTATANRATQRVMRGELFALQGYAEILLAELFCSGVPLSTLDFQQDFTYQPSSSSAQVYADARTKLDSAIVLAAGSDSVLNLARVLKGRAQLNLGNYAAAADDVALVPTTFQYRLTVDVRSLNANNAIEGLGRSLSVGTIADREGENGLPFLSSGDPRVAVTAMCSVPDLRCPVDPLTMPAKYFEQVPSTGNEMPVYTPFVVASGIEARLIEAEAALQHPTSPQWLTILNTLRQTATVSGQTGALGDITDPGSDTARVSLLFQERAYWLFMTGHRQGDLRRLIRQYRRTDDQVYPSGVFMVPDAGPYGRDVTVPIPSTEYANPNYHGCRDRNA